MNAFLDVHHHLLYGIDDGPINRAEMERMLQVAYMGGARTIIATPHIIPGVVPFSQEDIAQKVRQAQKVCQAMALEIRILPGAEVLYSCQASRYFAEQRIPTLAGSNKVLIEFAPKARLSEIENGVQSVLRSGYVPVLAHIERYACIRRHPRAAVELKQRYDVQYQLNCGFLLDNNNPISRRAFCNLLKARQIDYVASDAHNINDRSFRLHEAYDRLLQLVGQEQADELTGNHRSIADFFGK